MDWFFTHCNSAIEGLVRTQVSASEIFGGRGGFVTGFSPSTSVLPSQYHSTNAPHSSPPTCCSYQKYKPAKPGNLPKNTAIAEMGGQGVGYTAAVTESLNAVTGCYVRYTASEQSGAMNS
jgi:hypothetical protein